MSNSLQPHGLQHTRLPCPSPTPRAYSNSCPSSQWYIQPSHSLSSPSPPAFNLSQHQGLFQWVRVSPMAQMVKNLPAMWETWVWSLGWKDPLEKGIPIYSSILAWRNPTDRGAWWAGVHRASQSWTWLKWLSTTEETCNSYSMNVSGWQFIS